MPLYAFRCPKCSHQFDRLLSLSADQSAIRCPECGAPVERMITTFGVTGSRASAPAPVGGG